MLEGINLLLYAYIAFGWYINTFEKFKTLCKNIYLSNPFVQIIVDNTYYNVQTIIAILINKKLEPMKSNWICYSFLIERDRSFIGDSYYLINTYDYFKNNIVSIQLLNDISNKTTDIVSIKSKTNILEGMITVKIGKRYLNLIYLQNSKVSDASLIFIPCNYCFLSIKYTNPLMKTPIYIDIDKEYYYKNNEILSPLFIKRYLEHQSLNYYFDMNYVVEILDDNVQSYIINSNQYILLGETNYIISSRE
jgi:hypothetical protein